MRRAVIFDFDGTLADTEWLHFHCFRQVLREEGVRFEAAPNDPRYLGINDREGFLLAFFEAGRALAPEGLQALLSRKAHLFRLRLGEVRLFPGARELVAALAPACPLAIASGGRGAEIDALLSTHDIRRHFLAVLSADEVARSKPQPDCFLSALAALRASGDGRRDLEAADCRVVEDSLHGIRAARAAGMRCLAVAHTYPASLLAEADRVAESIAHLSPRDLLD